MRTVLVMTTLAALVCLASVDAEETAKGPKAACPVSGGPINKDRSVAYKDGKVFFCCPNCPNAFAGNTAKFAAKANHQLVVTKQYLQASCPISGQKLNPEKATEVAGVNVEFCCGNCLAKVEGAAGEEQINLAFADAAFGKGFKPAKK